MTADKIIEGIEANVWNYYDLSADEKIVSVPARTLLSPDRLDVLARYIFVKQRNLGWGVGWGTSIYRHYLETCNADFIDGDKTKSSFSDYLRSFSKLSDSVAVEGWNFNKGLLPHVDGAVIDGAHRLSVALYHDGTVEAVQLKGQKQVHSADALLRIGISPNIVEQLVNEFISLDEETFTAILFPSQLNLQDAAVHRIGEFAKIIYTKDVALSDQGRKNVIELLYGHEPWWKTELLEDFVNLRFPQGGSITAVFFKANAGQTSRTVKERAREIFPAIHFIHANDTHQETRWIADCLLNPNGIQYLNLRPTVQPPRFRELLDDFRSRITSDKSPGNYCIDSSAVMAAFGIRDCRDLDYITPEVRTTKLADDSRISWHNEEYLKFPIPVDELVANPAHHFVYKGVKFMALDTVMFFKRHRWAEKDIEDCRLILEARYKISFRDRFATKRKRLKREISYLLQIMPAETAKLLKRILPTSAFQALRQMYRRWKGIM
ncbi:hypothetical protein M2418_002457 [Rhizobium sp. BIGb0125]|uniref:hypothetical protein n=1 Tax=Rhizobium sp. BIGb0125 TaxID=2940618 RepID=UPI0021691629|nr:hypothetical protein [Rhizobium sp. BIGb0125]MCS4242926.1 hypothetical protein [Rhizobium sp. BIGb0125]